ncbi:MAG TPA: serine/threonine-protein kinase [Nannocystis sp.]
MPGGVLKRRTLRSNANGAVDLSGQVLGGRYRLLRPLGQGGMAIIYEAEHVAIGKRVALKVLAQARCSATVQRFLMEARAAAELRHEHIIDVTDFGQDTLADGEPVAFLAMEYLEGEDLAATLEQDGPLRWTRVLAIGKQICRALIAAHDQGIVHCDIKPANCYRIQRGETADYIKVLDFGVASFACKRTGRCTPDPIPAPEGGRPRSGPRIGTPGYMAAELLRGGSYDHRVDIYALGVLMYRLLTNKMPYPAAKLYAAASDSSPGHALARPASATGESSGMTPVAPFPMQRAIPTLEISPAFEAVVLQAIAHDPEQRQPNARALYEALVAAEQASMRGSLLPRDPLCWGATREVPRADDSSSMSQTEVSRPAFAASGLSNAQLRRTAPDLGPGSSHASQASQASSAASGAWRPTTRPAMPPLAVSPFGLLVRATLALGVTTAVVRAAWALVA